MQFTLVRPIPDTPLAQTVRSLTQRFPELSIAAYRQLAMRH